jgi:HTH-type transcriptional regulator/antitoxin HipB
MSKMEKNEAILNAKNFDELLDIRYGKVGTWERDEFEENAQNFIFSELLNDENRFDNFSKVVKSL